MLYKLLWGKKPTEFLRNVFCLSVFCHCGCKCRVQSVMFHLALKTGTRLLILLHGFCQEALFSTEENFKRILCVLSSCGLFLHCYLDVACLKIWFGVIRHLTVFSFILGCCIWWRNILSLCHTSLCHKYK